MKLVNRGVLTSMWGGVILLSGCLTFHARANGIDGDGVGARSMAMGGADVAYAADPLGAMGVNPAGLGNLTSPELNLGALGGIVVGNFNKPGVSSGDLGDSDGALPEGAFAMPIPKSPVVIGLSFVPESMLLAKWHYDDPPGGLGGVSYGDQLDKSEILELRSAIGAGVQITSQLSFGASFGLIYNENKLQGPYIFQNLQPGANGPAGNSAYNGAKTLLNLQTSGYGWNAQVGFIYRPTPDLQFGVSYESPTTINSSGTASGDPSVQFGLPQGKLPFSYDATVKNIFPQQVRFGSSWKFLKQFRLALQIDWVDWADAFHTLPLTFNNGDNANVNAALGSTFNDSIPLNWKSEFVYRAGLEYNVTDNLVLRAGYSYGSSPVPDATLTPLNASILEQTVTAGVGYHWDRYQVDLAYQYDLPSTQSIGTSGLLSGEYSNSSIQVSAHIVALTTTVKF